MNEDQAGRELVAEFHRLVEQEPPFRTNLTEALRAAERDGRRRRNRSLAVRGGVTALAIAASTALVLAWPSHPTSMAPPIVVVPTAVPTPVPTELLPVRTSVTPTPVKPTPTRVTPTRTGTAPPLISPTPSRTGTTPTPASSTPVGPSMSPMDRLERLVRAVAQPAGGVVTLQSRDEAEQSVVVSVSTDAGRFEVSASLSSDLDNLEQAREMCRSDGSSCTTQWTSTSAGVWSRVYPSKPGRESLEMVAVYPEAPALSLGFTNYTERADGVKEIGPGWAEAGLTVSGLRQAESASGLSAARPS